MNRPKMNTTDPDMVASWAAMVRAGKRAVKVARMTGTCVVVCRDGKLVKLDVSRTGTKRTKR